MDKNGNDGNISGIKIFVGGPIQYAFQNSGRFDPYLRQAIELFISVLLDEGFQLFSAHFEEHFGEVDFTNQSKFITVRDFNWMKQCDIYMSILPSDKTRKPYRSDGTCIELGWASALKKNIIMLLDEGIQYSHLIHGLSIVTTCSILDFKTALSSPHEVIQLIKSINDLTA